MRKVSLMLVAALLLSTGSIFAIDLRAGEEPSKSPNLSEQIREFLSDNNLDNDYLGNTAEVLFMLNEDREIVVISVDSEEPYLEDFIKVKLNYKHVDFADYVEGKQYTVAIKIAS